MSCVQYRLAPLPLQFRQTCANQIREFFVGFKRLCSGHLAVHLADAVVIKVNSGNLSFRRHLVAAVSIWWCNFRRGVCVQAATSRRKSGKCIRWEESELAALSRSGRGQANRGGQEPCPGGDRDVRRLVLRTGLRCGERNRGSALEHNLEVRSRFKPHNNLRNLRSHTSIDVIDLPNSSKPSDQSLIDVRVDGLLYHLSFIRYITLLLHGVIF